MAPAYKLTYFNVPYLAEPIRFLFSYGNIEFEDVRIEHSQWPELKKKTPFGVLPTLEHNGKVASQSVAIARYVAKLVKLTGRNDWEDLEIDAAVDTFSDIRSKLLQVHSAKEESQKEALIKEIVEEYLPKVLKKLDEQAVGGYLVAGRLTWADVNLAAYWGIFPWLLKKDVLADYPNLQKVNQNVLAQPGIKTYVANRPEPSM